MGVLGLKGTLAVKSYSFYAATLTHLAEDALEKTVADYGRLERELGQTKENLDKCMIERSQLEGDLKEYVEAKARLDNGVTILKAKKKNMSDQLKQAGKDRDAAQVDLEKRRGVLDEVAAHFPALGAEEDMGVAVGELKESITENFENGFELALEQMRVLHPGLDEGQFDVYKVVRGGHIVDEEEPAAAVEVAVGVPQAGVDAVVGNGPLVTGGGEEENGNSRAEDDGGHE